MNQGATIGISVGCSSARSGLLPRRGVRNPKAGRVDGRSPERSLQVEAHLPHEALIDLLGAMQRLFVLLPHDTSGKYTG